MKLLIHLAQAANLALVLSGCAHWAANPLIDKRPSVHIHELQARFHYPKCAVSVPLSQDQAIVSAESVGTPRINEREDWLELITSMVAGDELRHVWCNPRRGPGGVDLIGVFRGGHLVAEVHTVFVD